MIRRLRAWPASHIPRPADRTSWRRGDVGLVVVLAAFVAVAASWRLTGPSLVLDEASTWAISGHGFADLMRALAHSEGDAGALYLLVAHGWLRVWGVSEVALRGLSVVCAVGTIPVFFAVARRLLDHASALVAVAIFALNPFLLEYARNARMYTFALMLSVVATYCFLRLVGGERRMWWWLYGFAATAAIYGHAFSMLVIFAHACSLLCLPRSSVNWSRVARAFGLVLLLVTPLFVYVAVTNASGVDWIAPFSLEQVRELAVGMTGSTPVIATVVVFVVAGTATVLVGVTGRRVGRSQQLWTTAFPVLTWLLPAVLTAIVSYAKPFFVTRYLIVALPGYVLTLGVLFQWLRQRLRLLSIVVTAAVVAAVGLAVPAIDRIWGAAAMNHENWRAAESYVAAHYQSGDGIVIPIMKVHPFGYYASRDPRLSAAHPVWAFPYGPWTVTYTPPHRHHQWMRGGPIVIPHGQMLWIVLGRPDPDRGLQISWRSRRLDAVRRTIQHDPNHTTIRTFNGVIVYRYRTP